MPEGYTFGWNSGGVNLPVGRSRRSVSSSFPRCPCCGCGCGAGRVLTLRRLRRVLCVPAERVSGEAASSVAGQGRGARIAEHTIGESHGHLEHATLPHSLLLGRAGPEAERMVLSPLLSGTRKVSPGPKLNADGVRRRVGANNIPLFGEAHLTESHNRVSVCVGRGGDGRRMG